MTDRRLSADGAPLPELLAPAGSPESLVAAIEAGADAVYLGFTSFSNRMRAKNFGEEELSEAVSLCALYGVKCYVTVNTRVYDREWDELDRVCRMDGINRADGLIVADAGVASLLKERIPHVPLHASTQITGTTAGDAKMLKKLGFSRMICPRELTGGEIARLVRESGIDIEMFIHGAHCVSVSGQCLMSYAMGGRSPNRGECAQPCRLGYTVENGAGERIPAGDGTGYPLSLKDMCLARRVPELIKTGVASLKIEGRLKTAEYVRGVTSVYRRLLDENRGADDGEMEYLTSLFSRSGFTDGYFTGDHRMMTGIRGEGEKNPAPAKEKADGLPEKKIRLSVSCAVKSGAPATLTLSDGRHTVMLEGDVPDGAISAPLDEKTVADCMTKFGGTPYSADPADVSVELDGGLWLTRARLNDLRRRATEALIDSYKKLPPEAERPLPAEETGGDRPVGSFEKKKIGQFRRREQLTPAAAEYFDLIVLPESELFSKNGLPDLPGDKLGILFPPVGRDDRETGKTALRTAQNGVKYAVVNTFSQLDASVEAGLIPVASPRFNASCSAAIRELRKAGARAVTASVELSVGMLAHMTERKGAVVYGRFPLMLTERCPMTDGCGRCSPERCRLTPDGSLFLRDRKGMRFPMLRAGNGRCLIVNANPVFMADRAADLRRARLSHEVFLFTVESAEETDLVIKAYENGSPPDDPSGIRRL
ncbi:MAG: U32 family peptidase [Clostridia bacterium]|nr:U32 family peptidase [Clostridia bacterium]